MTRWARSTGLGLAIAAGTLLAQGVAGATSESTVTKSIVTMGKDVTTYKLGRIRALAPGGTFAPLAAACDKIAADSSAALRYTRPGNIPRAKWQRYRSAMRTLAAGAAQCSQGAAAGDIRVADQGGMAIADGDQALVSSLATRRELNQD